MPVPFRFLSSELITEPFFFTKTINDAQFPPCPGMFVQPGRHGTEPLQDLRENQEYETLRRVFHFLVGCF